MSAVSNTSHPCSNPGCTQVGNFQKCGKCESVYYHSKECQKEHWKHGHREACADLTKKKIEDVTAKANSSSDKAEGLKNEGSKFRNDSSKSMRAAVYVAAKASVLHQNPQIAANSSISLTPFISPENGPPMIRLRIKSPVISAMGESERMAMFDSMAANITQSIELKNEADKKAEKAEKASKKAEKAKERAERLKANLNMSSTASSQSKPAGSTNVSNDLDVD